MQLKHIYGCTSSGRNSFLCQPATENIIYIAGCVVVLENHRTKRQNHLISESKLPITSLAISNHGKYLAAANCGLQAEIFIWDLTTSSLVARLPANASEVACMSFSNCHRILIAFGSDKILNMWDWQNGKRFANQKMSSKIRAISFAADSLSYFVTVGDAHVNFWHLQYDDDGSSSIAPNSITCMKSILGDYKKSNFCDVRCGLGAMSRSTFCITKSGLLCELNEDRLLHKWVDLKTSANCLAVSEDLIIIGCAAGVVRCFNATDLRFLKNLPKAKEDIEAVDLIASSKRYSIGVLLKSKTIHLWALDLQTNPPRVSRQSTISAHSSCVWGVDFRRDSDQQPGDASFITCSSDNTLRLWTGDPTSSESTEKRQRAIGSSSNSDEETISRNSKIIQVAPNSDLVDGSASQEQNFDDNNGLRCLKVSPYSKEVACGSRSGCIRIFNLETFCEVKCIAAHDAEVLCLEYSNPSKFAGYRYLASASRDRLIHIFNDDYQYVQTLDEHFSSVTSLKFVNNRARDCLQLVSCGTDKRIIFRNATERPDGQLEFVGDQMIESKIIFYDMDLDSGSACLMAACQDRMIRLFSVAKGRYQSGFQVDSGDGLLIKIALDPSYTFVATSSSDRTINLIDFHRGECIAKVSDGLSDLITDLKFSPDGQTLVASSGNGCIFIYATPGEVATAIVETSDMQSLSSCSLTSIDNERDNSNSNRGSNFEFNQQEALHSSGSQSFCVQNMASANKSSSHSGDCNSAKDDSASFHDSEPNQSRGPPRNEINNRIYERQPNAHNKTARFKRTDRGGLSRSSYQSRDNLDLITRREQFVSDMMTHNDADQPLRNNTSNGVSLSGQFSHQIGSAHGDIDTDTRLGNQTEASPAPSKPAGEDIDSKLCKDAAEELLRQAKYAVRLHQQLGNAKMASVLAKAMRNSSDILSIALGNHQALDKNDNYASDRASTKMPRDNYSATLGMKTRSKSQMGLDLLAYSGRLQRLIMANNGDHQEGSFRQVAG